MGGNEKFRALRLNHGNFGWASEGVAKVSRIVDVVYNATSNEMVRTKTLVKGAICTIDATPFRQYYETAGEQTKAKLNKRERTSAIEKELESQFMQGKLLAKISSRPGQCGRADGYILEGAELEFYVKKMKTKKGK